MPPQLQETPAAPAGGGGSLLDKVGGPRNAAILAAGGTVAIIALLTRKKGDKGDAAPTPIQAAGSGFDSGPYDMWNAWQNQYESLSKRVDDLQTSGADRGGNPPAQTPVPIDKPPVPTPAPPGQVPAPAPKAATVWYTAHTGDTYSGIASKYGHTWQDLWNYQLQPGIRPASTQATLRQRGPNSALFNGSSVAIPGDWKLK